MCSTTIKGHMGQGRQKTPYQLKTSKTFFNGYYGCSKLEKNRYGASIEKWAWVWIGVQVLSVPYPLSTRFINTRLIPAQYKIHTRLFRVLVYCFDLNFSTYCDLYCFQNLERCSSANSLFELENFQLYLVRYDMLLEIWC